MLRRRLAVAALALTGSVAVVVVGAGPAGEVASQVAVAEALPEGVEQVLLGERAYLLAAPLSPAGLPVVVVLHGRTDSAAHFLEDSGALAWVAARRAVVAAPLTRADLVPTSWNAGTCCDRASALGVDDVGAIGAVVTDVVSRTGGDAARVSVLGFSNGAMLGYRLACERPGLLAGLVAVAGARLVPCAGDDLPPVLHVHGDTDLAVPVTGTDRSDLLGVGLPSAAESTAVFPEARLDVVMGLGHRFTSEVTARAAAFLAGVGLLDGAVASPA